jgi:hypothetical protein
MGVALLILAVLLLLASVVLAGEPQGANGTLALSWWTIDTGGQTVSEGGDYSLGGTIGQTDTDLLEGGDYTLQGGFWAIGPGGGYKVFLPIILRGS